MSTTEIPPGPSSPSTSPPPPEGDIYSGRHWESAYRDRHATPELLIQLQDDLAHARKREAFWISVVVHILLAILIINLDRIQRWLPHRNIVLVNPKSMLDNKENTFLALPPDTQKITKPPKSDILSDKNRIATSRIPQPSRQELKRLLDSSRPGPRAPQAQPQPQPPAPQQAQAPAPAPQTEPPPAPAEQQMAKLQPPPPPKPSFNANGLSAGSAIQQAARAAAANRGGYSGDNGGGVGFGHGKQSAQVAAGPEILSDTMGVDFGPYLERVVHIVKENWINQLPDSARAPLFKQGKVSIEFAILKDGTIAGMRIVGSSGDVALDRGAYGGITLSSPFPQLPTEFPGKYLALRFNFYYNPDDPSDLR